MRGREPEESGWSALIRRTRQKTLMWLRPARRMIGKKRPDSIPDAPRESTAFVFPPKAYAEFLARFDAPPKPNRRLRKSLQTPAPWET